MPLLSDIKSVNQFEVSYRNEKFLVLIKRLFYYDLEENVLTNNENFQ